jgi:hypothetical protein
MKTLGSLVKGQQELSRTAVAYFQNKEVLFGAFEKPSRAGLDFISPGTALICFCQFLDMTSDL